MLSRIDRRAVVAVFCYVSAAVLVFSSIQHLKNPYSFLVSAIQFRLLPETVLSLAVSLLPGFQLATACCLVVTQTRSIGLRFTAVLFLAFTAAQMYAMYWGLKINCGCFGQAFEKPVTPYTILPVAFTAFAAAFVSRKPWASINEESN